MSDVNAPKVDPKTDPKVIPDVDPPVDPDPDSAEQDVSPDDLVVPSELLELHVALEDAGVAPEDFKEAYGGASTGR